jgi:hypothetical protein
VAQFWTVIFLGVVLKIPLIFLFWAIWRAAKMFDAQEPPPMPQTSRLALCAYCGTRITVGYDAAAVHLRAAQIAERTGQAAFDIESRLVREELSRPRHYAIEPSRCPGCGEIAAWAPIEPLDEESMAAIRSVRK